MFQVGEYVIYSSLGVCEVRDITVSTICAEDGKQYYKLVPVGSTGEILVPLDTRVAIRPVLSAAEVNAMIDAIPSMNIQAFHARGLQELKQHYNAALSSHEPEDLLRLIFSIRQKKRERLQQNQRIGVIDENCQKRAMNLLYGEFAISLGIPVAEVDRYVCTRAGITD